MKLVSAALALIVLYLFDALARGNPFDRIIGWREYRLQKRSYPYDAVEISFTKHATIHSVYKAIHHVFYSFPETKTLVFDESLQHIHTNNFAPFQYDTLDFSKVTEVAYRRQSGRIPCKTIRLPRDLSKIEPDDLSGYHETLVISSQDFVPLSFVPSQPVNVAYNFRISVPSRLVELYENDPNWSQLRVVDDDGNVSCVHFGWWG